MKKTVKKKFKKFSGKSLKVVRQMKWAIVDHIVIVPVCYSSILNKLA